MSSPRVARVVRMTKCGALRDFQRPGPASHGRDTMAAAYKDDRRRGNIFHWVQGSPLPPAAQAIILP